MMHKKNMVAAIKVDGKVLRESSDRVSLPFGSEYSILLKNLDSVRVQARIWVDGVLATEGRWLVIEPNSSVELERFMKNGNLERGNRFKFIERTEPIESARGIKVDDGLIRVEYKKEFVATPVTTHTIYHKHVYDYYRWYPRPYVPYYKPYWYGDTIYTCGSPQQQNNVSLTSSSLSSAQGGSVKCAATNNASFNLNDAGITVPGSESNQKFTESKSFATESQTEVMVLHLIGYAPNGVKTKKPVTVDVKPVCVTCNKRNKAMSKFCSQCGTALEII